MRKEAVEHLENYLKDYEPQIIEINKTKQSNNKAVYMFQVLISEVELCLYVATNNDNQKVVNTNISSYELPKENFEEFLAKKTEEHIKKQKKATRPFFVVDIAKEVDIRQKRRNKI